MPDTVQRTLRFDARKPAGAFGDLGTFVPFVLAYIPLTP